MRKELLLATTLTLAACSAQTRETPPVTTDRPPSTNTTVGFGELSEQEKSECLLTGAEKHDKAQKMILPVGKAGCMSYAQDMYDELAEQPVYAPYLNATDDYFGYKLGKASRFQEASGIPFSQAFDALTMQTMRSEIDRLKSPEPACDPDEDPDAWTREVLVDRLASMGAFTIKYAFSAAPRTDLLDPAKSSSALITQASRLTYWALCNDVKFSLMMVNTGHSKTTLSGNTSQHVEGDAFDVRPFNGDQPLATWPEPDNDGEPIVPPEHWIASNPAADDNAQAIMGFLETQATFLNQTIWTDSERVVQSGVVVSNFSHGQAIDDTHHEHIHIGVNS